MLTKLYQIRVKRGGVYVPLNDIEYTLQEANEQLKNLCLNHPGRIFRRQYLRTQDMVTLSVHTHKQNR